MSDFTPHDKEIWEICRKLGSILAKRQKVTQIAILDLYDEILKLLSVRKDKVKCSNCSSNRVEQNFYCRDCDHEIHIEDFTQDGE